MFNLVHLICTKKLPHAANFLAKVVTCLVITLTLPGNLVQTAGSHCAWQKNNPAYNLHETTRYQIYMLFYIDYTNMT